MQEFVVTVIIPYTTDHEHNVQYIPLGEYADTDIVVYKLKYNKQYIVQ